MRVTASGMREATVIDVPTKSVVVGWLGRARVEAGTRGEKFVTSDCIDLVLELARCAC